MRRNDGLALILCLLCLAITACSSGEGEASPTPEPEAVLTAAAETAAAQMTENAKPMMTNTVVPDQGEGGPTATPVSATTDEGTAAVNTPRPTPINGGIDLAEF